MPRGIYVTDCRVPAYHEVRQGDFFADRSVDHRSNMSYKSEVTIHPIRATGTKAEKPGARDRDRDALERLIAIAKRDTGQSRKVADFLLAWWNGAECGGFDLTDLWAVDTEIAEDMLTVIQFIARCNSYPDQLGYRDDFQNILTLWRPASEPNSQPDR